MDAGAPSAVDPLASGWEALAQGDWETALAAFARAIDQDETPEALEGLGFAAWWLNDAPAAFQARERAYRRFHERGDPRGAARVAIWLSIDHTIRRGEHAIASGWLHRAASLLADLEPGPEQALLACWDAHLAIEVERDAGRALRLCQEAAGLARSLGAGDLVVLAQACEGYVRVCQGDVAGGMRLLDAASAAAVGGDVNDPDTMTMTCCYLISACERVRDVDRAAQWCDKLREIAVRWSYQAMFSYCRTHYAGVLIWRGAWPEAETELTAATEELAATLPAMAPRGIARLAELRRRQGRWEEAASLYDRLDQHPLYMLGSALALLGRAALALDRGDPVTASQLSQRYLRAVGSDDLLDRVAGLELLIRAHVAQGDHERARHGVQELAKTSDLVPTAPLQGATRFSEGVVAVATGNYEEARQRFEDAVDCFTRSGAPYETARARLELASVQAALGRTEAAADEARAALATLQSLGALHDATRAANLIALTSEPPLAPATMLTARERDVLRLIAQGMSDKEMASALGLSRHTIHRHVSNILTKLDQPSRAAAVAYASQHGLI